MCLNELDPLTLYFLLCMVLRLMQRLMTPSKLTLWKLLLTRFFWTRVPPAFKWPSIPLYPVLGRWISISLRTAFNSWSVTVEFKLDTDNEHPLILPWTLRTFIPKNLAMSVTEKFKLRRYLSWSEWIWNLGLPGSPEYSIILCWGLSWSRSIFRRCKLCWRSFMLYKISL